MSNVLIKLENISKIYDKKYVIKNVSLDIYEGEFLTLLGPSGCGKTTILRMISGLESVNSGKIYLEGEDITDKSPTERAVNTIFQNFALFPHMTVWENVYFGLKMKKVPLEVAEKRIKKALSSVKLDGYEKRYPRELSGGEQQRVAIARGIVMNHKVLLLDESLCSLDLKLKREMQVELKKLQKKLGMTFIYVTHDQDEALTMSDRIAIINRGNIEQLGTPKEIYYHPKTTFIADFIGESNIIKGTISKIKSSIATVMTKEGMKFEIDNNDYVTDQKINLMVRPENIKISKKKKDGFFEGIINTYLYDGALAKIIIELGNGNNVTLKATLFDSDDYQVGDNIYFKIDKKDIVIIGEKNEEQ